MGGVSKKERYEGPAVGGVCVPSMVVMAMVLLSFSLQSQLVCAPRVGDSSAVAGPDRMPKPATFPRVDISKKRYLQVKIKEKGNGKLSSGRTESEGEDALDILVEDVRQVVCEMNATHGRIMRNGNFIMQIYHEKGNILQSESLWEMMSLFPDHEPTFNLVTIEPTR